MKELLEKFKKNAELTTARVEIMNKSKISEAIYEQIKNETNVLFSVKDNTILEKLPQTINYIQTPSNNELKNTRVCLTDSICGIAETGSVIIDNKDYISYFSMLSRNHIVILDSNNLYERPRDIFNNKILLKSSSFSIITGPSATADMGSLVRGVHGPQELLIIIITSNER